MATVLPSSSLVDQSGTLGGTSKVDVYGLSEFIWNCRAEKSMSYYSIAKACNDQLRAREDGKTYYEITLHNVSNYCEGMRRKIQKYKGIVLQRKLNKAVNVVPDLQSIINRIKIELDKLQEGGGPVKVDAFTKLITTLNQSLSLLVFLKERAKPYISIEAVQRNVNALVSEVEADQEIPINLKRKMLQLVARMVLTPDLITSDKDEMPPMPRKLLPMTKTADVAILDNKEGS
jgi:hypothetical protein